MAATLSIRMGDDDLETLDRLVVACRAYYEAQSEHVPALAQIARETTRSSALRDLLLAWRHGCCEQFSREITRPVG